MRVLGNILWVLFGGAFMALLWLMAGLLCCVTIIMIPVGMQCFKFAGFVLWPFGKTVYYGGGAGGCLLNALWLLLLGWELALTHVVVGLLFCITIVGIPFGVQCFKFARLALTPFGAVVARI